MRQVGPPSPFFEISSPAVDDDVDTGSLHAPSRLRVSVERKRTARAEREHVRPLGRELLVRHLDDLDPAFGEQVQSRTGASRG